MTATIQTTIVGVFETRSDAEMAIREMKVFGISENQLGMILRHANGRESIDPHPGDAGTKAVEGAAVGVATGAGLGALWALGIAANLVPAIGPVISGGILTAVLASAAGGAAAAGLAGALVGLGIPEEEAVYYEGELKSGRTLVTVQAPDHANDIYEIIHRNNGVTSHATSIR